MDMISLYRPYTPFRLPISRESKLETAVPVFHVWYRYPHHAMHSGYDRLTDYVGEPVILSRTVHMLGETLLRIPGKILSWWGGHFEYSRHDFVMELQTAVHLLRHRSALYHFLYGEKSFKYLRVLAGMNRHVFVATLHHPPAHYSWLFRRTDHLRHLAHVIVVSSAQQDFVGKIVGRDRVSVIPVGVDTDFYRPASDTERLRRCVFVGYHERDIDTLSRVIEEVLKAVPDSDFVLISSRPQCRLLAQPPRVKVFDQLDEESYRHILRTSRVLVLPLRESTAVQSVLESMACGVPVVVTRGGVADYVDESCAVCCGRGDSQAMARAAIRILKDDQLWQAMSTAAVSRAAAFAWPCIAEQVRLLYRQVADVSRIG